MTTPAFRFQSFKTTTGKASRRAGFSLAECILSVGITASSLLAVMGMLTGTLGAARESREETIAGVLLHQLVGEVRDLPKSTGPDTPPSPVVVLVDESLQILEHSSYGGGAGIIATYQSGSTNPVAAAFAKIERVPDTGDTLMDRVIIRIESPASAPATARKVSEYAALSPK